MQSWATGIADHILLLGDLFFTAVLPVTSRRIPAFPVGAKRRKENAFVDVSIRTDHYHTPGGDSAATPSRSDRPRASDPPGTDATRSGDVS